MAKKKKEEGVKEKGNELEIKIPEGVEVVIEGNLIKVKGEKGELSREFPFNDIKISKREKEIILTCSSDRRSKRALLGTTKAHIQNMIHGVSDGVMYRMKIVYSHFPINVKVQGDTMIIDNFFGEKYPRKTKILEGVDVEVKGQDVILSGINKEKVSQTAANIEQATRIKGRDLRVFQDGIYIVEKDGKSMIK
ncbi:MAG TPA: 50S ribosomal protein L6 [Candidatus Altiarchaeales archaeon]|nr:50S ribosomal protein L6 [Candidatus Altiarchaeales archaeon]